MKTPIHHDTTEKYKLYKLEETFVEYGTVQVVKTYQIRMAGR
jgi:hypothetical protein